MQFLLLSMRVGVLLTGIVGGSYEATKATKLAWKIKGVKEVINEIQVATKNPKKPKLATSYMKDTLITISVKARNS